MKGMDDIFKDLKGKTLQTKYTLLDKNIIQNLREVEFLKKLRDHHHYTDFAQTIKKSSLRKKEKTFIRRNKRKIHEGKISLVKANI